MPYTAVVIGATGLVGQQLTAALLKDEHFITVRVLVRRPIDITHPKLDVRIVDFNDMNDMRQKLGQGHMIFCAIGTTRSKVKGNMQEYRKVDYDIAVNIATLGKEAGFNKYVLVSSVGANAGSKNFYLRLKCEVEDAISKIFPGSLHIFRPGMLMGNRKEFRLGEVAVKWLVPVMDFLMMGSLKKYRSIHAHKLALAMIASAKQNAKGINVYHYPRIIELATGHQ